MHKRIFFKYYTICVFIVFLTVSVLGFATSTVIGVQSFNTQSQSMERAANKVASTIADLPKNYAVFAGNIFDASISTVKETIKSEIFVFNQKGEIALTTLSPYDTSTKNFFSTADINSVLGGEVCKRARSYGKRNTTLGYTVGVPIVSGDNNISGAVFVTTSEINMRSIFASTFVTFACCGFIVLIIAFIVLIFVTRRMTKPINDMYVAANKFKGGDFSTRLNVSSSNEYAPLVNAFNSMADGIENLEGMRRGFIADVSHELRTPMTAITGFVDGVLDGTIPPELHQKYLKTVSEEAHRMSRLVDSFLDIAKIQAGQISYVKKPFDIVATIGKVLFAFEEKIAQKNIDLSFSYCDDYVLVLGDEDAIYRVVFNLVDNALKFTEGGGKIDIGVNAVNDKVQISIYNTGCGISKEDAANIFERFYKADKSRSQNKRGTGIGLYLVKNIIKEHGEDIILTSKEGEYARFSFTLPACEE